jgi:nicotinamidase-related amidase
MITVEAEPYDFVCDSATTALLVLDMQRDFLERGGFGEMLGNAVALLHRAVAPTRRVLAAFRTRRLAVIHTREGHRADLSDCPPSKRRRGRLATGIGDPGPMGRHRASRWSTSRARARSTRPISTRGSVISARRASSSAA